MIKSCPCLQVVQSIQQISSESNQRLTTISERHIPTELLRSFPAVKRVVRFQSFRRNNEPLSLGGNQTEKREGKKKRERELSCFGEYVGLREVRNQQDRCVIVGNERARNLWNQQPQPATMYSLSPSSEKTVMATTIHPCLFVPRPGTFSNYIIFFFFLFFFPLRVLSLSTRCHLS